MLYLQHVLPLFFKNCCTLVPVPVSVSVQLSFGLCIISLISRMFSLMENFKRKYTRINPLDMFSEHPVQWLWKVWYSLKQAPRAFFHRFSVVLFGYGFQHSTFEHSIFVRHSSASTIILIVYVADIVTPLVLLIWWEPNIIRIGFSLSIIYKLVIPLLWRQVYDELNCNWNLFQWLGATLILSPNPFFYHSKC